jgi:hypothetical protein
MALSAIGGARAGGLRTRPTLGERRPVLQAQFSYVGLRPEATMRTGAEFLLGVIAAFPYAIHTVLTDEPCYRDSPNATYRSHLIDRVCRAHGIARELTKPYHPWTNGQAERMVRPVKEATVQRFHYDTHDALAAHLAAFLTAYNFAKHLKALRWRTPFKVDQHRVAQHRQECGRRHAFSSLDRGGKEGGAQQLLSDEVMQNFVRAPVGAGEGHLGWRSGRDMDACLPVQQPHSHASYYSGDAAMRTPRS